MRVAIYGPYCDKLYGLLHLTPQGVVPEPLGLGAEKDRASRELQSTLKHWRMPGASDEQFMQMLPQMLRGRAVLLNEGEVPTPGFNDLPDDEDEGDALPDAPAGHTGRHERHP